MNQEDYNLLSIICTFISLVITGFGLFFVIVQIKKVKDSIHSTTHSNLCSQSVEILQFLSQHPETYDYFYNNKTLENNEPKKIEILYATEMIVNFMEQIILQKVNMPDEQWVVWNRFVYSTCEKSVTIRNFIREHKEWYSKDLVIMADRVKK